MKSILWAFLGWICGGLAFAGQPVTVTFTILRVIEVHCDEGVGEKCPNDYYVEVNIANQGTLRAPSSGYVGNNADFSPFWRFTRTVDSDLGTIPIEVKLWDQDDFSDDDQIDIAAGDSTLNLTVDLATGTWTGDVPANVGFSTGTPDDAAKILFDISLSGNGDLDGDGIPDSVERFGVRDGNGVLLVDMAALGADPCRKTIAVEIDFMQDMTHSHRPSAAALNEVRAAFNAAPVPATNPCPYAGFPQAPTGIGMVLLVDDAVPEQNNVKWGAGAETIRDNNFDAHLRPYFHYNLWGHDQAPGDETSGLCCSDNNTGKDFLVTLGTSWLPTLTTRQQSGLLMHELGHALGLDHGGGDGTNCKPNYLSIMSYSFTVTGIPNAGIVPATVDTDGNGTLDVGARLDYSRAALNPLNETNLNESAGIGDGTDFTSWSPDNGATILWAIGNAPINWNNSNATPVSVDINNLGFKKDCTASPGETNLMGFNDWANLKFRAALSPGAGAAPPPSGPELDYDSARKILESLRVPPGIIASVSPDPTKYGWNNTDVTVTFTTSGPVPATSVRYSFSGAETGGPVVVNGTTAKVTLTKEGETTITYSATNQFGNSAPQTIVVRIDKTEPCPSLVASLGCELWPADRRIAKIGEASATDDLSGIDTVSVSASSSEPDAGLEPGDLPGDIVISGLGVSVRAEYGPSGTGRIYSIKATAVDKAGNVSVRPSSCAVYKR